MKKTLKEVFGFDSFRPLQAEIIENVIEKKDTLVIMPTGGGKSLCYQLPALLFEGMTIVVSPLISLMKDQVEQLRENGIPAVMLNSSIRVEMFRQNVEMIRQGNARLLYIAPESLLKPRILQMLSEARVDCFAIDEAHCISFWGHDFRPEYRKLVSVRERFSEAGCIALTATATPRVREDIKKTLGFSDAREFVAGFDRENLMLRVWDKENPYQQTLDFIRRFPDESGIIYCFSRKQVDTLARRLHEHGFSALPYHAGLGESERNNNQEAFIRDDVRIMVATIAFGMGINKPNIRFILHHDLPQTLENYYQEIGRAGRDGLRAECLLLFGYGDIQKIKYFIKDTNEEANRAARMRLDALLQYAESHACRRIPLLSYFGEKYRETNCGMCDNCRNSQNKLSDMTIPAQKFLSCVKRTGEIFGPHHVIDVLRGSMSQKVQRNRHHLLSTHGIGKDFSKKQWFQLSRQFLTSGYMKQDPKFGGLSLTEQGWEVLRSKVTVKAFLPEETPAPIQETVVGTAQDLPQREQDRELFEKLRKLRKELADEVKIPPYAVFPDKTLIEMATYFPKSKDAMENIHGVGRVKLERYGEIFIEQITEHCREHGIGEVRAARVSKTGGENLSGAKKKYEIVGQACAEGKTIPMLMEMFGIKETTVLAHLYNYLRDGNPLEPRQFYEHCSISEDLKKEAVDVFGRLGCDFLRPVFEALEGRVSYEDLRVLSLFLIARMESNVLPKSASGMERKPNSDPDRFPMVCLAASRKYSGFCLAGKELGAGGPGNWVRPVSKSPTGELTAGQMELEGGRMPRLLDILRIPFGKKTPRGYQTENFMAGNLSMSKDGTFPFSEIDKLCDYPETLWINGYHGTMGENDRMPVEMAEASASNSLYFIRPGQMSIIVEEGMNLLKRVRAKFTYNDVSYRFMVTDPEVEKRYLPKPLGEHPMDGGRVYLTISISEPFHGYCYKLAAGVIGLPPSSRPSESDGSNKPKE